MRVEHAIAYPEGCLTLKEAGPVLAEGLRAIAEGVTVFDLAAVAKVDSAALSLLLSWRREAQRRSRPVSFRNLPDSLLSLTRLYGLTDLIH